MTNSALTTWLSRCDGYAHAPTSWNTFHVLNSRNTRLYFALRDSGYTPNDLYTLYVARCAAARRR